MYKSPQSLQEVCIDFICENISSIGDQSNPCENNIMHMFKYSDCYFPHDISDQLLDTLCGKLKLTDQMIALFDYQLTRLQRVHIHDASKLTSKGLNVLRLHKILELVVIGLTKVTVNDLIGCFGDWTLEKLQSLNVSRCTFVNSDKVRVVVALSKLRNLRSLNVSNTEFNRQGLEIVTEDLPLLEHLDISGTKIKDIYPLKKCQKLKYLNMYNVKIFSCTEFIFVLHELRHLCHLDISDDKDDPLDVVATLRYKIADFLKTTNFLPHLVSLDISGQVGIYKEDLKSFICRHPKLKFLGLMQTDICFDDMFTKETDPLYNPELVVTGCANEAQILESLRRYLPRKFYIQKCLYHLYSHTQNFFDARVDVIKLVLPGMREYPKMLGIQMAATACFYTLSKGGLGMRIHPYWLKQIVDLTLIAMGNFPKHQQLQKNSLLTLCSDRILQDVTFHRYRCAELVMESLVLFDDPSMNRMSVAICSILAAKISTAQTSCLGAKSPYMERLLNIVKVKTEEEDVDIMMKFTLSALWNLTDESPPTCTVFLDMGGMELFLKVLQKFPGESAVETKVLGLVNNIAEVEHLRPYLMMDNFLSALRDLLHSTHGDVSYFAAGIIAHLASELNTWTSSSISRKDMLLELGDVVLHWNSPETQMVAYRTFTPFFALLSCFETFEVQLWAMWAIHHVCAKNPKRYCSMLVTEGGVHLLESLINNPNLEDSVGKICLKILQVVKQPVS